MFSVNTMEFNDETEEIFQGRQVYRQQDKFGDIKVIDYGRQRALCFDNGHEQSRKDLFRPAMLVHEYMRAMLLGQIFAPSNHATVLGLGGGCLVRALRALDGKMFIAAVELRQAVAEIAQRYFGLPDDSGFQLTITDALYYLKQQTPAATDIIFSDLYHAHHADQNQTNERFIKLCHRHLNGGGWLVINYHQLPALDSAFFSCLNSLFTEVFVCATGSDNHIIYAGKNTLSVSQETRKERVAFFQLKLKSRFDLLYSQIKCLTDQKSIENI